VWAVTATPTIGSSMKLYSKILPALLLLILVVAFVVCAGGLVTTFSPKAAAAEIPRESTAVYVCEQSVTYYGYGCNTSGAWAKSWSGQVARKDANVHGATTVVVAGFDARGTYATMQPRFPLPGGTRVNRNLGSLLRDPAWATIKGSQ